jgi:hypothetical protein
MKCVVVTTCQHFPSRKGRVENGLKQGNGLSLTLFYFAQVYDIRKMRELNCPYLMFVLLSYATK